jgi:hypothetical protein
VDPFPLVYSHALEAKFMYSPLLTLAVFALLLALCGLFAHWYGRDTRDEFADQAHRPPRR